MSVDVWCVSGSVSGMWDVVVVGLDAWCLNRSVGGGGGECGCVVCVWECGR